MSAPSFLPPSPPLEAAIRAKGEQLFALMDKQPPPALFSKKGAYARLMEWSMKDPVFKTQLFRFVDVLPSLQSSAEIVRHLQEYLGDKAVALNPALKAGLAASSFAPRWSRRRSRRRSWTWPGSLSPARMARTCSGRSKKTPSSDLPPRSTCSARLSS